MVSHYAMPGSLDNLFYGPAVVDLASWGAYSLGENNLPAAQGGEWNKCGM